MAYDKYADAMLARLAQIPSSTDSVTLVSGAESCGALFDDGEVVSNDTLSQIAQEVQTAVRYWEGAITLPVTDATVTIQWPAIREMDDVTYKVRQTMKDPNHPGFLRVVLSPT